MSTMAMRMMVRLATLGLFAAAVAFGGTGCATPKAKEQSKDFFTSGNPEADQRADQRMAKTNQLRGEGTDTDKGAKGKAGEAATPARQKVASTNPVAAEAVAKSVAAKQEAAKLLYDRLGGEAGIKLIVEDFVPRMLADPRVNFERKGVTYGGWGIHRNRSVEWKPDAYAIEQLKKHFVQSIAVATGGPAHYDGKEMKQAHANLHITNAEFDASMGDLDKLEIPNREQKELLAVVESVRPQVVEER
jgi:hemoglobin